MGTIGESKPSVPAKQTGPAKQSGTSRDATGIVVLGAAELREILSTTDCLAALERAYARLHERAEDRGRSIGFETSDGKFHVKAGLHPGSHKYFAAKINANFPDNPRRFAAPTIQGLIVLCACDDGRPVAILQSGELTGRRTAAATALAAKHGARPNSRKLAIIGCGAQAKFQAEAILAVTGIEEIIAFDCDDARARSFVSWTKDALSVTAKSVSRLGEAVRCSDICVTCTTSTRAIVDANMVPPGCFIAAVGADNPDKQEIDLQVFARARIIVDDAEQCAVSGDLAHALRAGAIADDQVHATLAQLAAGVKQGRRRDDEIVIFDSTGSGVQDVAVAAAAYEIVCKRGVGRTLLLET